MRSFRQRHFLGFAQVLKIEQEMQEILLSRSHVTLLKENAIYIISRTSSTFASNQPPVH